jgi:hypothetical protein
MTMSTTDATRAGRDAEIERFIEGIDPAAMRDARHWRAVAAARVNVAEAEAALRDAVDEARAAGDSWTMIGLVLGTSKQAAHRKFSRQNGV